MFKVLEQLATFAKLSHKMEVILIHVYFMEIYDVRMVYLHQNVEFTFKHADFRIDSISVNFLASKSFDWIRLFGNHIDYAIPSCS